MSSFRIETPQHGTHLSVVQLHLVLRVHSRMCVLGILSGMPHPTEKIMPFSSVHSFFLGSAQGGTGGGMSQTSAPPPKKKTQREVTCPFNSPPPKKKERKKNTPHPSLRARAPRKGPLPCVRCPPFQASSQQKKMGVSESTNRKPQNGSPAGVPLNPQNGYSED